MGSGVTKSGGGPRTGAGPSEMGASQQMIEHLDHTKHWRIGGQSVAGCIRRLI